MIYRTTKMEDCVRELAKSNRLICVRTHHRVRVSEIRFRANSIADLPVHFYRPGIDRDGAILRWQEMGGVLIDPTPRVDHLPEHDVQLFTECPLSVAMMQAQTPVWIQLIAPALAALGVTAGSMLLSLAGRRRP